MPITRRRMVSGLMAAPALVALAPSPGMAQAGALPPTPACGAEPKPTPRASEGPFYTPGSPRRHDVAAGVDGGQRLVIGGFVLTPDCRPVADAVVEVWQADQDGKYDNAGQRLRGHELSEANGRWWFATILPALYPGRTRHIHVKVRPPQGRLLTTQLFFPGEPGNARDSLFDERLLFALSQSEAERFGRYDFIVA